MKKRLKAVVFVGMIGLVLVAGAGFVFGKIKAARLAALPTDEPTVTDTAVPTSTWTPSIVPTMTASWTPTATQTFTPSMTLTPTSTLSTLVVRVTAVNQDVTLLPVAAGQSTSTTTPLPTVSMPTPPVNVPLIPTNATTIPLIGWFEREMTDPALQLQGKWDTFVATYRSANKRYLYTDDANARLTYRFLGAGARVRYVAYYTYGIFQVVIDGRFWGTIDSYYPQQADGRGDFRSTEIFGLPNGWHTLEIVHMGRKAPESGGTMIAIDAIDTFLDGPEPSAAPTGTPLTPSPTPSMAPAQIQVIIAPPPVQPTTTPLAPGVVSINFALAYDQNGNKAIDPDEGVQGVSIRLVTSDTNQIVASGYTNTDGVIHLEATTNSPLRLVVPYFDKYWDIPTNSSGLQITMIIPPANQPGLIP